MNNQAYQQLLQDLAEITSEITEPPCDFEDEPETVYFDADFNDIWGCR